MENTFKRPWTARALRLVAAGVAGVGLAACVQVPTSPSVAVLPGPNKPFDQFLAEDRSCRDFAHASVEGTAQQSADTAAASVAIGTVVGAAAGALIGGHNGAGVGAGIGLIGGSEVGAGQAGRANYSAQHRYDIAYQQCMYSHGNQIPGSAYYSHYARPVAPPPPPGAEPAYMPPPGLQPPPPLQ